MERANQSIDATLGGVIVACLAAESASAQSGSRRIEASALPLYLEELTLTNNESVEFTTAATTAGADPILHLLRRTGSSWIQVAVNDDFAWPEARISFVNSTGSTQSYLLVLRNKTQVFGTTFLSKNGQVRTRNAPVGGQLIPASDVGFGPADEIITRHRPGGSVAHALLTITSPDLLTIDKVAYMNGAAGSAILSTAGSGIVRFLVGTPWLKSSLGYDTPPYGLVDIFGNDIGTDVGTSGDSDTVGSAVEALLGTCPQPGTCQYGYFATDSDRDGLTDGEELWGITGTDPDGRDDIAFGRWGADPTRKDAFVEVDYAFDFDFGTGIPGAPPPPGTSPFSYMHALSAKLPPQVWSLTPSTPTVESWVDTVRAAYLAAPSSHIKNLGVSPPGGLQVHFDLGVAPFSRGSESKFGDYGSATSRCLVKDWNIDFLATTSGNIVLATQNTDLSGLTFSPFINIAGLSPLAAALLTSSNIPAGQAEFRILQGPAPAPNMPPTSYRLRIRSSRPCTDFIGTLLHDFNDPDFESKVQSFRDSFEALRARNRSPFTQEFDAVRRTRFRYAVLTPGGQAGEDRLNTWIDADTFIHELGHTLGLAHWGRGEWALPSAPSQDGPMCLPHYRSVMNYYHDRTSPRFAVEDGLFFNPSQVSEGTPFGPNGTGLGFNLPGPWRTDIDPLNYLATATMIDFDRSGSTTPDIGTRRSWGLAANNKECDAFREGETAVTTADTIGSSDLVRVGNRLYAFWMTSAGVFASSALLGPVGNKSCFGSSNPRDGTPCLTWSSPQSLIAGSYTGFSAIRVGTQIFLALTRADQWLEVRRYNTPSPLSLVLPVTDLTQNNAWTSRKSAHPPELTFLHDANRDGVLAIIYRSQELDRYYSMSYAPSTNTWSSPSVLFDGNLAALTGSRAAGALAWPGPDATAFTSSERRTLVVLPDPNLVTCRLYILNPNGNNRWIRATNAILDTMVCDRQPSLALRTRRGSNGVAGADAGGHIMVAHTRSPGAGAVPMIAFSGLYSRTNPPSTTGFSMLQSTNYWISGGTPLNTDGNLALYSDVSLDNVFGLAAMTRGDPPNRVSGPYFYPHGDGAPNFSFGANSDFRVMEDETCRLLRSSAPNRDELAKCGSYVFD